MSATFELLSALFALLLQGAAVLLLIELVWFLFAKATGRKY